MQRGYFDDFRDFRDTGGKVWQAPDRLAPASQAPPFPELHALRPDGSVATFPPVRGVGGGSTTASDEAAAAARASLVIVAFRAGAQEMVEAWAAPFADHFRARPGAVALLELALIESRLMGLWPFKAMLLRGGAASEARYALPATQLFHFGGTDDLRKALHMTNRLTGCVRGELRCVGLNLKGALGAPALQPRRDAHHLWGVRSSC